MSNTNSLKHFTKGTDDRRKLKPRAGTGAKDRLKKMAEEIEKTLPALTPEEISKKIISKLTAQTIVGDIDSIKLLSKFVPISTSEATDALKKISEKKLIKRSRALLQSFADRQLTQEESTAYSTLLKSAVEIEVIPKILERVKQLEKSREDK